MNTEEANKYDFENPEFDYTKVFVYADPKL